MAERKGLSAPANPGEELRRLMREEEQEEGRKEPSNEGGFIPSLEGRKEVSNKAVQEDRKETSNKGGREGAGEGSREAVKETAKSPVQEGWKEDVKARAKAGSKEARKVRLNVDIPADVHLAMKMWCLKEGYNLNELVPALVAAFIEGEG